MQRLSWWAVVLAVCLVLGLWPGVSATAQAPAGRRAVATESGVATLAAMETLRAGGHAVDAAITAALVLGVVNPVSSGLGGGGFALVWDARLGKTVVLDFRETAPAGIDPRALDTRPVADANRGVLIGVPGEGAGLLELHRRWGRRSFASNAAAAIRAAERGFPLGPHMDRTLRTHQAYLSVDGYLSSLFYPNGIAIVGGSSVRSPALAATLRGISSKGARGFYEGAVGASLVAAARRAGSRMTREDLAGYAVIDRPALRFSWEGYEVHTMPPPSAGGILLAQTLLMHDKATLAGLGEGSA
ncbi:MAG: gamma-glutamyltransferase, partial [Deltaproteobacteria bacterium HGW-Deltaproteobacteria-20]